jgi:predicted phosphoribosyltransferase
LIQQQKPSEIIVALPVATQSALHKINELTLVNNTICLDIPGDFHSVGQFYEDFSQVTDKEVIEFLKKSNENYLTNYSLI